MRQVALQPDRRVAGCRPTSISSTPKAQRVSETNHSRSAKAHKVEEVQAAGNAKAGAGHPVVTEGGPAPSPIESRGHPKPAASTANADGSPEAGTSSATAGKAEKLAAVENAALTEDQHGRGRRKAEAA